LLAIHAILKLSRNQRYTVYRRKDCRACPRKSECAPKATGRSIVRHDNEASITRMRERMDSEKGKHIYRERFKTVEPVFAWMKWATGFDRFRLRGKDGAPKEFLLLSIGHNIKQIAKYIRTLGPEDRKRAIALTLLSPLRGLMSRILFAIVKKNSPQNQPVTTPGPITIIA